MTKADGEAEDPEDLESRIGRLMTCANGRYDLWGEGDRILVAVSGGKDSWTLLHLLLRSRRLAPFDFDVVAYHLDQGQPGFDAGIIRARLEAMGVPHEVERKDTWSVVREKLRPGVMPCSLCSRLRRGTIYGAADRLGCNKIALGHHLDDACETLLLNLFFSGTLKTMPPKLRADDGRNVVIRPLLMVPEELVAAFAQAMAFPIVPCGLCGSGSANPRRKRMKRLIRELQAEIPELRSSMLGAMGNVRPTHLLDSALTDHGG